MSAAPRSSPAICHSRMDFGLRLGTLTGALLDRLTHHVHILEMNGESFRLVTSKKAQAARSRAKRRPKAMNEGDPVTEI
jgi:IstB-like ATP binding protein